ncbi:MAG: hypothetical protein MRY78_16040, partial [Saprospiraceae bacterium]|nr:hypothetical protein [Saprospiraceae bacterium]
MLDSSSYAIPQLPLTIDVETKPVLRALSRAHRSLAELKGTARTIPNLLCMDLLQLIMPFQIAL